MDLGKMRKEIDDIDIDILRLIAKRFEIAIRTRRLKQDVQDVSRESSVKDNVRNNAKFLVRPEFCEQLFEQIMNESRHIQNTSAHLIGFSGIHGSLAETAIEQLNATSIPCDSFNEVLEGIKNGVLDGGILPFDRIVEESSDNPVLAFLESGLFIHDHQEITTNYCLMTLPSTDYRDIKIVYSHPDVLSHAEEFLTRTKLQPMPHHGSAQAALMLSSQRLQACAVIAPAACAQVYNLSIVKDDVLSKNITSSRYLHITKERKREGTQAALYFEVSQSSGTLNNVLEAFAEHKVNLTKLESLATTNNKIATFLVEFNLGTSNASLEALLESVGKACMTCRLLGVF